MGLFKGAIIYNRRWRIHLRGRKRWLFKRNETKKSFKKRIFWDSFTGFPVLSKNSSDGRSFEYRWIDACAERSRKEWEKEREHEKRESQGMRQAERVLLASSRGEIGQFCCYIMQCLWTEMMPGTVPYSTALYELFLLSKCAWNELIFTQLKQKKNPNGPKKGLSKQTKKRKFDGFQALIH